MLTQILINDCVWHRLRLCALHYLKTRRAHKMIVDAQYGQAHHFKTESYFLYRRYFLKSCCHIRSSAKFLEKLNHLHLYIIVSFKLTIYLLDFFFQVHLHYLANNNVCRPEMSPTGRAGTPPRSSAPGRGGKRTATRPQRSAAGARVLHP